MKIIKITEEKLSIRNNYTNCKTLLEKKKGKLPVVLIMSSGC